MSGGSCGRRSPTWGTSAQVATRIGWIIPGRITPRIPASIDPHRGRGLDWEGFCRGRSAQSPREPVIREFEVHHQGLKTVGRENDLLERFTIGLRTRHTAPVRISESLSSANRPRTRPRVRPEGPQEPSPGRIPGKNEDDRPVPLLWRPEGPPEPRGAVPESDMAALPARGRSMASIRFPGILPGLGSSGPSGRKRESKPLGSVHNPSVKRSSVRQSSSSASTALTRSRSFGVK